jgi:hypothetical protein
MKHQALSNTNRFPNRRNMKMRNWQSLIPVLDKHEASPEFIAECVYAYIVNYGLNHPGDSKLLSELVQYLKGDEK